jgi:hypothetical protein
MDQTEDSIIDTFLGDLLVKESIIATLHPADRHFEAAVVAATPVPITIRSYMSVPDMI